MPSVRRQSQEQQARLRALTARFDHFVVRSEYDVETLMAAYGLRAEPLRIGYPRNDALVDPSGIRAELAALRERLGLTDGRRVVLYAPTFREATQDGETEFEMPFDVRRFARRFGDDHVLLVRTHYLDKVTLPTDLREHVRDVSGVHDVTPLLLLADVLVTDYSSLMFDFALLDRPMLFYTYDYEAYTGSERGAYFDLAEVAPGPLAYTETELFDALAALGTGDDKYGERRRAFVSRYGEYDRGTAARAVVERFFPRGGRGHGKGGTA
jgi:CDP-glycerol glycerophosphotransferase